MDPFRRKFGNGVRVIRPRANGGRDFRCIGVGAQHFAYPKAVVPAPLCEQEVRARFTSAALAGNRPNAVGCDLHRLWRTPIQTTDTGAFFTAKAAGGMRLEATVRDVANRVRYRGATQ